MNSPGDAQQVVLVSASMSAAERDAALTGLAAGVRVVEMPVDAQIAEGNTVREEDRYLAQGDVVLEAIDRKVWATRKAARPTGTGGWYGYFGRRSYDVSFQGRVDGDAAVVQGEVTSHVKRYNRSAVPAAIIGGLVIGLGLAVAAHHVWLIPVFAPLIFLGFLALGFVTDRREATIVLEDLERIAVLASGAQPPDRSIRARRAASARTR